MWPSPRARPGTAPLEIDKAPGNADPTRTPQPRQPNVKGRTGKCQSTDRTATNGCDLAAGDACWRQQFGSVADSPARGHQGRAGTWRGYSAAGAARGAGKAAAKTQARPSRKTRAGSL